MAIGSGSHLSQLGGGSNMSAIFEVLADPQAYKDKWEALERHASEVEARFQEASGGLADVEKARADREEAEAVLAKAKRDAEEAKIEHEFMRKELQVQLDRHKENVARWDKDLNERKSRCKAECDNMTSLASAALAKAEQEREEAGKLLKEAQQMAERNREERARIEAAIKAMRGE